MRPVLTQHIWLLHPTMFVFLSLTILILIVQILSNLLIYLNVLEVMSKCVRICDNIKAKLDKLKGNVRDILDIRHIEIYISFYIMKEISM